MMIIVQNFVLLEFWSLINKHTRTCTYTYKYLYFFLCITEKNARCDFLTEYIIDYY